MARVRAQRLHCAVIQLSIELCVSMTTEIGYGVDVNHKSSQNMATFQTKLLRSINLMVFHFYSNFSGAQTFLRRHREIFLRQQVLRTILKLNLLNIKTTLKGTNHNLIGYNRQNMLKHAN